MATKKGSKKNTGAKAPKNKAKEAELAKSQAKQFPADQRPLLFLGGGCVLALVTLIVVAVVGFAWWYFASPDQGELLYSVQEQASDDPFVAIMGVRSNGRENAVMASESDGLYVSAFVPEVGQSFLAPRSNNFVLRQGGPEGELLLFSEDRSLPIIISNESVPFPWFEGFSPDGKYFAYTSYDEKDDDVAVHVVDLVGDEVLRIKGAAFGAFLPGGKECVVLEVDTADGTFTSIAMIGVSDGDYTHVVDLKDAEDWPRPFLSPDGKEVYYFIDNELNMVSLKDGSASVVYEFASVSGGLAFFAPDGATLVILDPTDHSELAELLLLDTRKGNLTRIDKDVYVGADRLGVYSDCWGNRCLYGESLIAFSPDGNHIAYLVNEPGDLDLYVAGVDGSDRTRLASEAVWFSVTFSPDKQHIVYVFGEDLDRGGDLYIAEYDGSNSIRLDTEVWSFEFVSGGRALVYFRIDHLDRGEPESEMYGIGRDGEGKERLMPPDDGIFTFVHSP